MNEDVDNDDESADMRLLRASTDEQLRGIVANLPDNLRAEVLRTLPPEVIVKLLSLKQRTRLSALLNQEVTTLTAGGHNPQLGRIISVMVWVVLIGGTLLLLR